MPTLHAWLSTVPGCQQCLAFNIACLCCVQDAEEIGKPAAKSTVLEPPTVIQHNENDHEPCNSMGLVGIGLMPPISLQSTPTTKRDVRAMSGA